MDIEMQARLCATELLLRQMISEYLRSAPDPREQANHTREQLRWAIARMPLETQSLDDEAKLRVRIEDKIAEILDLALQRTVAIPLNTRSRDPDKDAPG